jgi:hypothetical protein
MSRRFKRHFFLYLGGLVCALISICVLGVVFFKVPEIQRIRMKDGAEIQYLGMTYGGTNWNPAAPKLVQMLQRFPKLAGTILSHYPVQPVAKPWFMVDPAPVLWFYSPPERFPKRGFMVHCIDAAGEEIGFAHRLGLLFPVSNAVPVVLKQSTVSWLAVKPEHLAPDDFTATRFLQVSEPAGTGVKPIGRFEIK